MMAKLIQCWLSNIVHTVAAVAVRLTEIAALWASINVKYCQTYTFDLLQSLFYLQLSMSPEIKDIEHFIDLVDELNTERTGTFDILGIGNDERSHSRFLAWLLQPNGSHGLDTKILSCFLSEAGVSSPEGLETATVGTFDQDPSNTELDIVIETDETIICIEVKTRELLGESQCNRQVSYLEDVVAGTESRSDRQFDNFEYIYLASDANHNPEYVQHRVSWVELLDSIRTHAGSVDRDTDAIRLREWVNYLRSQLSETERLAPATEIQLAYPELVDQYDIDIDSAAVETSRQRILSSFWQWLQVDYEHVANGEEGWDTERSQIQSRTKYLRMPKSTWPKGLRFEIQATEKRMTAHDNHSSDHNQYRTLKPHIELTLSYSGVNIDERDRLLAHLSSTDKEILDVGGFEIIRDNLPNEKINDYHVYSKQVPIEFSNPEQTVDDLKEGMEYLMELEATLDTYGKK
jgi:hypothetical protein